MFEDVYYVYIGRLNFILDDNIEHFTVARVAYFISQSQCELEVPKDDIFKEGRTFNMFILKKTTIRKMRAHILSTRSAHPRTLTIRISVKMRQTNLSRTEKFMCNVKGIKYDDR